MDPETIKLLTQEIQRLQQTMERMTDDTRDGFRRAAQSAQRDIRDVASAVERETDAAGQQMHDLSRTWAEAFTGVFRTVFAEGMDAAFSEAEERIGDMRRSYRALKQEFGTMAVRGQDSAGGFIEGLRSLNRTVFSGLPFGGVLGVMLFGEMRKEEAASTAQQVMQVLENAGGLSRAQIASVEDEIRRLQISIPGIEAAFRAANASAAQLGFTASDLERDVGHAIDGVQDNVRNLSIAMDRFFEVADGTSMQLGATIAINTNTPLREALELTRNIGLAAQDSGISFTVMSAAIAQATSSMRLQTNELKEAQGITEAIRRAQGGFQGEGMQQQRAGALAASGIQGVAGALANLSVGLKAVMGQNMTGGATRGLDAVYDFERGFRGARTGGASGEGFFVNTMTEMLQMSGRIAGGDEAKQYHVLKELFGLNAEQAQTLMALQRNGQDQKSIADEANNHLDRLNKVFMSEGEKQSEFLRMQKELIDIVAVLGTNLLDAMLTGFESLTAAVTFMVGYLVSGTTTSEQAAYMQYQNLMAQRMDTIGSNVLDAGKRLFSVVESAGGQVFERSDQETLARKRYYLERFSRGSEDDQSVGIRGDIRGTARRPQAPLRGNDPEQWELQIKEEERDRQGRRRIRMKRAKMLIQPSMGTGAKF